MDIYAPDMRQPARVEYWDDEIDSLASFDQMCIRDRFEPALIMRWIFKTAVSVWFISNTFDIVMAVFDPTQKVCLLYTSNTAFSF